MKVSRPVSVTLPTSGVYFAESVHAQDFKMPPRSDPYHKLLYVLRGGVRYREKARDAEIAPMGALLAVPAHHQHTLEDEKPSTLLLLCVSEAFLHSDAELGAIWRKLVAGAQRHVMISAPQRHQLEDCWRRALLERAHPRAGSAAAAKALALQVFVHVARLPASNAPEDAASRVATVARAMNETFFDAWSLDGAAARAGMSRRHFSAHFRAATRQTFAEYLTNVRLAHAAQLLQRGEHSVTGVIFACGFGDVSQFYRLFRARYGLPPKAWAEKKRGKTSE
jgi:AraC-like DNA-binding protein